MLIFRSKSWYAETYVSFFNVVALKNFHHLTVKHLFYYDFLNFQFLIFLNT